MNTLPISITDRLKTQHQSLEPMVTNINKSALDQNPIPGKWSIKDNIAHLACYQPLFIARMHRLIEQDSVVFERYNADVDPGFPAWQSREVDDLLHTIAADRTEIITLFMGLITEQLNRAGIHPKYGKLTMAEWAEFFLLHEAHHLFTIFQLVKSIA